MAHYKQHDARHETAVKPEVAASAQRQPAGKAAPPAATSRHEQLLQKVVQLIGQKQYDKALGTLGPAAGQDQEMANAMGVCLMRLGRIDEAVRLFRTLVLAPGCTWPRPNLPNVYKTNFATALLLAGHPSGCVEILAEVRDEQDPHVQRLRAAIRQWEAELGFFQKLNWWVARVEPPQRPVRLEFEPGELLRPAEAPASVVPLTTASAQAV